MRLWIARDSDGLLRMYMNKPILIELKELKYWRDEMSYRGYSHELTYVDLDEDGNPVELFPEVTFENSPKEVELKLVEEVVGVAESPLKTFPRVNEFETGASYRR